MKIVGRVVGALVLLAIVAGIIWRWETNGWGSLVWLVVAIATPMIRAPFANRTAENTITEKRETGTEPVLLFLVMAGTTFLPIVHLLTGVFSFADYDLPTWATVVGAVIPIPALWLFWRSHADLGRNWSVTLEVREEHTLVTNGVYRRVRHPMYTSLFALYLASPLLLHNWIAGFSGVVSFAVLHLVRVANEERMMRDLFGAEYEAYVARTGRLLPRLAS
ncbi:MAG: protein-S-isoprenylcysteine O-methyltransferase [Actinomycetota bacterium]